MESVNTLLDILLVDALVTKLVFCKQQKMIWRFAVCIGSSVLYTRCNVAPVVHPTVSEPCCSWSSVLQRILKHCTITSLLTMSQYVLTTRQQHQELIRTASQYTCETHTYTAVFCIVVHNHTVSPAAYTGNAGGAYLAKKPAEQRKECYSYCSCGNHSSEITASCRYKIAA